MSTVDSNTSLPEKKSGYTFGHNHNETLLLISLYQKYEVFFQCCFVQEKGNLAYDCRRHEEKWLLSVEHLCHRFKCTSGQAKALLEDR